MERYFHSELEEIKNKLILIGEKANEVGRMATHAFLESDIEQVEQALALDDAIDDLEREIMLASVRYITLRGPVSSDVRLIFLATKISHDFERVGDEAHSIAKKTRKIITRNGLVSNTAHIEEMSRIAFEMIEDAITCFVNEDIATAKEIIKRDKEVDRLNKLNFKELIKDAELSSNNDHQTQYETLLISKSLERIADHAKNLAHEVIYLLTGE